jgi:hypothetical protein
VEIHISVVVAFVDEAEMINDVPNGAEIAPMFPDPGEIGLELLYCNPFEGS